jgi:hypothetical protein
MMNSSLLTPERMSQIRSTRSANWRWNFINPQNL